MTSVRDTSHSRAVLSCDAVTIRLPSGLNEALDTSFHGLPETRSNFRCLRPTAAPSCPLTRLRSAAVPAERRAPHTPSSWPSRDVIKLPLLAPTPRRLVRDAVTIRPPSGLNEALHTSPSWPSRDAIKLPLLASHSRAVLSSRRGHDPAAVRAERSAPHLAFMAFQRRDQTSAAGVPQPRRFVIRRGHDPAAIRTERRAPHPAFMAFQRRDQTSAAGVPQPRRLVADAVTIRPPSGLNEALRTASSWPFQSRDQASAGRVPQPRRLVV